MKRHFPLIDLSQWAGEFSLIAPFRKIKARDYAQIGVLALILCYHALSLLLGKLLGKMILETNAAVCAPVQIGLAATPVHPMRWCGADQPCKA